MLLVALCDSSQDNVSRGAKWLCCKSLPTWALSLEVALNAKDDLYGSSGAPQKAAQVLQWPMQGACAIAIPATLHRWDAASFQQPATKCSLPTGNKVAAEQITINVVVKTTERYSTAALGARSLKSRCQGNIPSGGSKGEFSLPLLSFVSDVGIPWLVELWLHHSNICGHITSSTSVC